MPYLHNIGWRHRPQAVITRGKIIDCVIRYILYLSCVRIFSKGTKMLKLLFLRRGQYGSQDCQFDPSIGQKVTNFAGSKPAWTKSNPTLTSALMLCFIILHNDNVVEF